MPSLSLRGEHITLANALKTTGLAETGGRAKMMVREGIVTVNGTVETRPGRKLVAHDRFAVADQEWVLER